MPLCTVLVPVAQLAHLLQPRTDWGKHFYRLAYDVILSFGLTELTAQFAWIEDVCHITLYQLPKFELLNLILLASRETRGGAQPKLYMTM